jgi:hypothetical protein
MIKILTLCFISLAIIGCTQTEAPRPLVVRSQYMCDEQAICFYTNFGSPACLPMTKAQFDNHCPVVDLHMQGQIVNGNEYPQVLRLTLRPDTEGNLTLDDLRRYVLRLCPNATEIPSDSTTAVDFAC